MENIPEGSLKKHSLYQKNNFNLTTLFHQDIRNITKDENIVRTDANAVSSLINLLVNEKIPFCIPYHPIVYWPEIKEFIGQEVEIEK